MTITPGSALVAGRISAAAVLGTAATVAGAVLMLVAAAMLFTSRRRDGSRLRRWSRRGARVVLGLALAVMIASPVGMAFMAANRSDPPSGELDLGRPHEDVTLHTSDGLALEGSYVPSTNGAAVTTLATAVFSDSLPPPALHQLVPEIAPRPIMLIWSRRGNGEKYFDPAYYDRAGEPKKNWEIPESTHIDGLAMRPIEYERRVVGFFDRALS